MSQPTVCAIMLVNGRPEMTRRALRCFQAQTYPAAKLFCYDSGPERVPFQQQGAIYGEWFGWDKDKTIGALRNAANGYADPLCLNADVIVHWDSDDWSHPNRITEQIALLQSSGKECVGYRDMLFWETCSHCNEGRSNTLPECPYCHRKYDPFRETPLGTAWLYQNLDPRRPIGTSLCYWRNTWERRPFADLPKNAESTSEYCDWLREVDALGVTSDVAPHIMPYGNDIDEGQRLPRMVASIHGGNTTHYNPAGYVAAQSGTSWKRADGWDKFCREAMKL